MGRTVHEKTGRHRHFQSLWFGYWGGAVLELGFGLGMSAQFIQEHSPAHHVIIEMNRAIAETARRFAYGQSGKVTILEGMWQEIAP